MPQLYEWSGRALRSELLYEPTPTKKKKDPSDNNNDENQQRTSNEQMVTMKQKQNERLEKTAMISERLENYKMNKQKHLNKDRDGGYDDDDGGVYHSPDQLARLHRLRRMRKQQYQGGSLSPTSSLDSGKRDGRW